jgi:hypothetical protein
MWREGLADWGQTSDRIARFRDAVDTVIYTPGSSAGVPVTVLRSFAAPPASLIEDSDAMRERIMAATSGLLSLLGVNADPIRSREHILISNILDNAWRQGKDLDVAALIQMIQAPPFDKVGIIGLETFFPTKDRVDLAMQLNNLLASPAMSNWMEGEPLDVQRLYYTPTGKPRLSIFSIAHLSDGERMFFVTILLNEILAWMRTQPGTSSLRCLLYMDEVFGYFPPTANPPSKQPMLTLLKQARAFGLGVVLATQNPVDLDYKGLSNTGTWFLGRLQTERDKARVLEGLEGASAQAGSAFDRQKMEQTLAALGSRVFLMNNVHEDQPVVFQTRWVLSYLRGPLTRAQIQQLMADRKSESADTSPPEPAQHAAPDVSGRPVQSQPPMIPAGVRQVYISRSGSASPAQGLVYRPALLGHAKLHFVRATYKVDVWRECVLLQPLGESIPAPLWQSAQQIKPDKLLVSDAPEPEAAFAEPPGELLHAKNFDRWTRDFKDYLYQTQVATLWYCPALKEYSEVDESEGDFRIRLRQMAHEQRDLQVEKLRQKYAPKFSSLNDRMRSAEQRIERERSQANRQSMDSMISVGTSLLGALFGRKLVSKTNLGQASRSVRSLGRAAQQRGDVMQAQEKLQDLQQQIADLNSELQAEVEKLNLQYRAEALELEKLEVRPRKSDVEVQPVALCWSLV